MKILAIILALFEKLKILIFRNFDISYTYIYTVFKCAHEHWKKGGNTKRAIAIFNSCLLKRLALVACRTFDCVETRNHSHKSRKEPKIAVRLVAWSL